ncbi:hypothetical protein V1VFAS_038 [Rhizobium phage V1VFA-S]|nr:hypothetical protein V1VFAS_038 [Rhizobium phage V1VFA-S]
MIRTTEKRILTAIESDNHIFVDHITRYCECCDETKVFYNFRVCEINEKTLQLDAYVSRNHATLNDALADMHDFLKCEFAQSEYAA